MVFWNRLHGVALHKQSGQAIVTLSGKDYLLGPYKSKASKTKYDRLLAERIATGRQPPHETRSADIIVVKPALIAPPATTACQNSGVVGSSDCNLRAHRQANGVCGVPR